MNLSRGRRSAGRHARDRRDRSAERPEVFDPPADPPTTAAPDPTAHQGPPPTGPYDSGQDPPEATRFDLGSLQIPSVPGVNLKLQANPQGAVQRVMLVHGDSALHLVALAAPRSEPMWDEVREEIVQSLAERKVPVEEINGEYGIELVARVPGKERAVDIRFVGVDGPRWLVRADFQGPVARDPSRSPQLAECLRGLVVDRGSEARPAKEPLPLQLSAEMAAQIQRQAEQAGRRPSPQPRDTGSTADRM